MLFVCVGYNKTKSKSKTKPKGLGSEDPSYIN